MRLNTGRMIHHEVCCLLLSSLESLQTNLEEFSRLLGLETNMPKTENNLVLNNNLKNGFSSLKSSQGSPVKLRLANMSEFAKHIDNEEEFVEVANSHISGLCGELVLLWDQFLQTVRGRDTVRRHLAKINHFQVLCTGFFEVGSFEVQNELFQLNQFYSVQRLCYLQPSLVNFFLRGVGHSTLQPL